MAMFLINASIGSRFVGFCLRDFCRRAVFTLIALIRTSASFGFFFVPTETKLVGFFPSAHRTSHRRVVQVQNWWGETVFVHFYLMFPLHAFKLKMVFMFPFFHLHFTLPVLEIRFVFISPKLLLAPPAVCTPFHIAATWSHASDKFSTHFSLFFRRSISEPVDGTTPILTTTALIWLLFATFFWFLIVFPWFFPTDLFGFLRNLLTPFWNFLLRVDQGWIVHWIPAKVWLKLQNNVSFFFPPL